MAAPGIWRAITDDSLLMELDQSVLRLAKDACLPHLETSRLRKRCLFRDIVRLLKGFVFTEHHPAHYARHASPIAYDLTATCPEFAAKLEHWLPDAADRRLVQAVAAMWLLGHNLTQSTVLLHGDGQTGKSTLLAILRGLIGRHNCCELRTAHLGKRFEMFNYLNKSLLIGSDLATSFARTARRCYESP